MKKVINCLRNQLVALLIGVALMPTVVFASDASAEASSQEALVQSANDAKQGVVQVNYVYVDDNDKAHIIQGGSGILIGNPDKTEYVLTCAHILSMDQETKDAAYKYYGIEKNKEGEYPNVDLKVQVVAESDVCIEADVLKTSDELDMAILKLDQPIHTRTPLSIYTSEDGTVNELPYKEADKVHSLGFPDTVFFGYNEKNYSNDRVVMSTGEISNLTTVNDVRLIEHNITISYNNCGGPLVDENGRVIGMNALFTDGNYYCAIDSTAITKVLDALGIEYDKVVPVEENVTSSDASTEASSTNGGGETGGGRDIPLWLIIIVIVLVVLLIAVVTFAIILMVKGNNNSEPKTKKEKKPEKKEPEIMPFNPSTIKNSAMAQPSINNSMGTTALSQGPADSSGTTVLGAGGANQSFFVSGSLIRKKNKKQELIDKPVFSIGKDALHVNLCINDNTAISRTHAIIRTTQDGVYLEDCNSTNGTFVNGKRVVEGQPVKLTDGAVIKLANEEFEYRI